jgi:hypothetical protein
MKQERLVGYSCVEEFLLGVCFYVEDFLGQWFADKFKERLEEEVKRGGWDVSRFRNKEGRTVLDLFRKVMCEVAEEEGVELTECFLERFLDFIYRQYKPIQVCGGGRKKRCIFCK